MIFTRRISAALIAASLAYSPLLAHAENTGGMLNLKGGATKWSSAAACAWRDDDGQTHVIAATALNMGSKKAAEDAALAKVSKKGERCQIAGSWGSGCYYVAAGKSATDASWNSSSDKEEALANCRKQPGYTCLEKDVLVGCVN